MHDVTPDDILREKLDQAFEQETSQSLLAALAKIVSEHAPIDLAYAVSRLPPDGRPLVYDNLPTMEAKVDFMINTDSTTRTIIFRQISDIEAKKLIEPMAPDDAVAVLEDMAERRVRRLLDLLEPSKAQRIKEIKQHHRNTAGRLMTNEFFAFPQECTIGQASAEIKARPGIDLARQIYVLGDQGQLQGYVPARNLIVNPSHLTVKQVMRPVEHRVSAEASREEVVDLVERYKLAALAVVNSEDRLVGIITDKDAMEAMEDIADDTIAQMAGTGENVGEYVPTWKRLLARAPWLLVTLIAGLVNVGVMSTFQSYAEGALTFVLFFVPLINGLSGNIGLQCSTVLVRSMATGGLSATSKGEAVAKEVIVGCFTGVIFGILAGVLVWSLDLIEVKPGVVGFVVGIGLWGACLASTLLGVFSPIFFDRIGVDPAIASGPIVTAVNDFLSMSIYFLIALGLKALLL
jgi:magnesium transporter